MRYIFGGSLQATLAVILPVTVVSQATLHQAVPRIVVIEVLHATQLGRHRYPTEPTRAQIVSAARRIDVDGDRVLDWELNFAQLGSGFCGTGGCRLMVWRGLPNGRAVLVFDRQVRSHHWRLLGGHPALVTDLHGSNCGGFGAQRCPTTFVWRPGHPRLIELPRPIRFRYNYKSSFVVRI
ncbi:hypothetical protein ACLB0R_04330 [Sphingomonas sp. GlSt437]|uniref:hypothetical protein n=1 Tax=Sphingomonas sp. GlSt437 TaxID=3389970 RepID=UPI003A8BE2F8